MSRLKDILNEKVVTPNVETNGVTISYGIVTGINEKDNTCDITYMGNYSGLKGNKKAEVKRARGDDWFPRLGSIVEIQLIDDIPLIIDEKIDKTTARSRRNMGTSNIYSNASDSSFGGFLF